MNINFRKKSNLSNKENIVTALVILLCIVLFSFSPTSGVFQQVTVSIVFLLVLPILYIKIALKEKLEKFGFTLESWKNGFFLMLMCFVIMALSFYLIFNYSNFKDGYFLGSSNVGNKFLYLFIYEMLLVNLFVFLYEVFFRGFIMFYFKNKFGIYTIFVQFIFFLLFLGITEKLTLDYIFYIISAPLAGLIAYKSKSLLYSYLFSIIIIIAGDIIYLKLVN